MRCLDAERNLANLMTRLEAAWQNAMIIVNVHRAKTHLSKLLAQVEAGEDIVIARRGDPVARLVGCKPRSRRQPDVLKGNAVIADSFFDPLPAEELDAWEGN